MGGSRQRWGNLHIISAQTQIRKETGQYDSGALPATCASQGPCAAVLRLWRSSVAVMRRNDLFKTHMPDVATARSTDYLSMARAPITASSFTQNARRISLPVYDPTSQ